MKKNKENPRYKIELNVYGNCDAIDHLISLLVHLDCSPYEDGAYDTTESRLFKSNFSQVKFFKMCEKLERKFYERSKT